MLTKSTKTVTKTIEVEEEIFHLELTKDQLIELAGLLGNCNTNNYGTSLYRRIYNTMHRSDQENIDTVCMKFGKDFVGFPRLQHL